MLYSLHVKNLALIKEQEIDFSKGLNILTGETGAGKSVVIGSVNLALGGKADPGQLYPPPEICISRRSDLHGHGTREEHSADPFSHDIGRRGSDGHHLEVAVWRRGGVQEPQGAQLLQRNRLRTGLHSTRELSVEPLDGGAGRTSVPVHTKCQEAGGGETDGAGAAIFAGSSATSAARLHTGGGVADGVRIQSF